MKILEAAKAALEHADRRADTAGNWLNSITRAEILRAIQVASIDTVLREEEGRRVPITLAAKAFLGSDPAAPGADKTVVSFPPGSSIASIERQTKAVFFALRARYYFACQQIAFSAKPVTYSPDIYAATVELVADVFEKKLDEVYADVQKFREGER